LHRFKECIDYMHYVSIYNCDTTVDR